MGAQRVSSVSVIRRLAAGSQATVPRACLVDLESGTPATLAILDALHRHLPRTPIGLIAGEDQRDAALSLLRDRRVDRIVPACDSGTPLPAHVAALEHHGERLDALHRRLKNRQPQTLFVTGATGFLGGHFLRYLLRCGNDHVIALTRDAGNTPFDQRLAHLQRLHPERIECVKGDITCAGLGLSYQDAATLAETVDEVWHLAAITKFEEILREQIVRTNLQGTQHVVEAVRPFKKLVRFHHVSTAYTAGAWGSATPVPESLFPSPKAFRNAYEESKYFAEHYILQSDLPAVVYRPSIILGESISGLCDGQTVYNVAKMLRLARLAGERSTRHAPGVSTSFRVVVDPAAAKNLVSVDDVVCRMLHIAAGLPAPGSVYNLAHDTPTPMTELIEVIAGLLGLADYQPVRSLDGAALSPAEAVLERVSGVFRPYMLAADPSFATDSATAATPGHSPLPMERSCLHFLLRAFFEQHYGWAFGGAAEVA